MLKIHVNNKDYRIRFGYGVLCESDVIDKVSNAFSGAKKEKEVSKVLDVVAELLLAGLQKYHSDDFGYEKIGHETAKRKVYDLMDDYEDESTEENPRDCFDLFQDLQNELFENGFFKRIQKNAEEKKDKVEKLPVQK